MPAKREVTDEERRKFYWPCACTMRNGRGVLTKIKLNHVKINRCVTCDSERPEMYGPKGLKE